MSCTKNTILSLFVLVISCLSFFGCSSDKSGNSVPITGPICPVVTPVSFPPSATFRHDCDVVIAQDNYFCVEGVTIGNPAGDHGGLSIANPNGRAITSIIFALDWDQFKEGQQYFKDGEVSCLNPLSSGGTFEDAATTLCLTTDGLFDAIAKIVADTAAGKIHPTVTPGRCPQVAIP